MEYIKLADCVKGDVYRIKSRNLVIGVFDGKDGFIGIREKFGYEYLFCEHHWDTGPPYGTVHPLEKKGTLPETIPAKEILDVIDEATWKKVAFKENQGWYFVDTGEFSKEIQATHVENYALFKYLKEANYVN